MKLFMCQACGYVSLEGEAPERCPVCGAPKKKFEENPDAIKTPKDPKSLTELEKKHIPVLQVVKECKLVPETGCVDIKIRIGEILHPMLPEHSITRIDLYLDKRYIGNIKLLPEVFNPAVVLHLKTDKGTFSVIDHCNLHGNWISEAGI